MHDALSENNLDFYIYKMRQAIQTTSKLFQEILSCLKSQEMYHFCLKKI
jgi:hypothetical protein